MKFVFKKISYGLSVMLGVVVLIFLLFHFLKIDPSKSALGERSDETTVQALRDKYGLDDPLPIRLRDFLNDLSPISFHKGDVTEYEGWVLYEKSDLTILFKKPYLGRSFQSNEKVTTILTSGLVNTLLLAFGAILLALLIGISLGTITAIYKDSMLDRSIVVVSTFGVSIPSFFAAIVLGFLFGFLWKEYTGLNIIGSLYDLRGRLQFQNLILPIIALGVRPIAVITQLTRNAMLDVLAQDYIRTGRAKGLSNGVILWKHALKNALNPVITAVSGWFASLLAGAYFVEFIFNFKGMGYLTVKAIEVFDFPIIMGAVLYSAAIFVCITILVDILYVVFDPRIRTSK